jgi:hypothetical protein
MPWDPPSVKLPTEPHLVPLGESVRMYLPEAFPINGDRVKCTKRRVFNYTRMIDKAQKLWYSNS